MAPSRWADVTGSKRTSAAERQSSAVNHNHPKTRTGLLLYSNLSAGGDKDPLVSQDDTSEADERSFKPLHTQQVHFKPVCGREEWEQVCQHLRSASYAQHKSIPPCRSNPFMHFRAEQKLQLPRLCNANAGQQPGSTAHISLHMLWSRVGNSELQAF